MSARMVRAWAGRKEPDTMRSWAAARLAIRIDEVARELDLLAQELNP